MCLMGSLHLYSKSLSVGTRRLSELSLAVSDESSTLVSSLLLAPKQQCQPLARSTMDHGQADPPPRLAIDRNDSSQKTRKQSERYSSLLPHHVVSSLSRWTNNNNNNTPWSLSHYQKSNNQPHPHPHHASGGIVQKETGFKILYGLSCRTSSIVDVHFRKLRQSRTGLSVLLSKLQKVSTSRTRTTIGRK